MHKSWKFWGLLVGAALLGVVIDRKTKGKVSGFLAGLPVVGPFLA